MCVYYHLTASRCWEARSRNQTKVSPIGQCFPTSAILDTQMNEGKWGNEGNPLLKSLLKLHFWLHWVVGCSALPPCAECWLLIAEATLVPEHRLQGCRLTAQVVQAQVARPPWVGVSLDTGGTCALHWTIGEVHNVFYCDFFPHCFVDLGHPW